jgi:hypothetical protein
MGLFKKKGKVVKKEEISMLPDLPRLPELPRLEDEAPPKPIHQLPSFPQNSLGTKFSQNSIKDAVTGEKEGEVFDADEFAEEEDELRMMREPLKKPFTEEIGEKPRMGGVAGTGPVFVRLDKFEDGLKILGETKKQISGIEKNLEDIAKVRAKEEGELQSWRNEVMSVKGQIEKIDRDVFSKVR